MDQNTVPRLGHKTELLICKSPAQQRANRELLSATKNNMMQPNQFFGGLQTPDETESETDSRTNSIEFSQPPNLDQAFFQTDEEEEYGFDPMLNIYKPNFETRMRLYLKPQDDSIIIMFTLLIADTVLSITYICAQFAYVVDGNYTDD